MNRRLIRPNLAEIKEKIKENEAPVPSPHPTHTPHSVQISRRKMISPIVAGKVRHAASRRLEATV